MTKNNASIFSNNICIISPSGNLYGSERILLDFLENTQNKYTFFAPNQSALSAKAEKTLSHLHRISTFNSWSIRWSFRFYIWLFWQLLTNKFQVIYSNDGEHLFQIYALAFLFPKKKFVVHLRLIAHAKKHAARLFPLANFQLMSTPYMIQQHLPAAFHAKIIYDPFPFLKNKKIEKTVSKNYRIGIVGRLDLSKGLAEFYQLFSFLKEKPLHFRIEFHFYGSIVENQDNVQLVSKIRQLEMPIYFHGFVEKQCHIYENIGILFHFCRIECFPRVLLEALSYELPFIGFDENGVGEIARLAQLTNFVFTYDKNGNWVPDMVYFLQYFFKNYEKVQNQVIMAKKQLQNKLNVDNYVESVEKCLLEK